MGRFEIPHEQAVRVRGCLFSLMDYCKRYDWAGFDPYDALNSRIFNHTPFAKSRICRIAITQIMKRLPINLRPLLLVPREQNPKALALFLMTFVKLAKLDCLDQKDLVEFLVERLASLRSPDSPYWCWGYSFPWQTRTNMVPQWSPNLVCTSFVANALLDAFELRQESRYLSMAKSAGEYMLNDLYWTEDNCSAGFSYPFPGSRARVHNANFLGSALFCRLYKHSGDKRFLEPALKVAQYSSSKQHADGSWDYGELPTQRWIDNFHTGYNLCALESICQNCSSAGFEDHVRRGFQFYRGSFFTKDNAPRYFHNATYPIDTHSVAQSIITLLMLSRYEKDSARLAMSVFEWARVHMWDSDGCFYYQVMPFWTNKISYMRWSQAWMLLALATLLEHCGQGEQVHRDQQPGTTSCTVNEALK